AALSCTRLRHARGAAARRRVARSGARREAPRVSVRLAVPASARGLDDETVPGSELRRGGRAECLDAAVRAHAQVTTGRAVAAAREPERRHDAAVRQDRDMHRLEELEVPDDPVPAPASSAAAGARADLEA